MSAAPGEDQPVIGSRRALGLAPYAWEFHAAAADSAVSKNGAYDLIRKSKTPKFTAQSPYKNEDVTVESFKNLWRYGVVVISAHGGGLISRNEYLPDGTHIYALAEPWIILSEEVTDEKFNNDYIADIKGQRVYKYKKMVRDKVKKVFSIRPEFFNAYARNRPKTIFYLATCDNFGNPQLYKALRNNEAGAVAGFDDSASIQYLLDAGGGLFESMISGKNMENAFNDAIKKYGSFDKHTEERANFKYIGEKDMVLEATGIRNGGFEDGSNYWETNGSDFRIIGKLAGAEAKEGNKMAIISTGLGSVTDSDALISQTFKIPAYAATLSFVYDVVSEEPMEYVSSDYDDKFEALLETQSGGKITLVYESINSSSWLSFGRDIFAEGDETTYHTGWKTVNYNVSALAGQSVTLSFHTWDVGDSAFDTAALIDSIALY